MKYLLSVSLCLCLFAACSTSTKVLQQEVPAIPFWNEQLRDSVQKNSYRITIEVAKVNISGIWIVKKVDGMWKGTLINEFGLKMFDFTCTAEKCQLINVVTMIDKWYIKRTLAGDVQFMLEIDNSAYKAGRQANRYWETDTLVVAYEKDKEFRRLPTNELVMRNEKRNITYSLKRIE